MLRKLDAPEFLTTLGKLVLDFGFMESAVHIATMIVARDMQLAYALVPPSNTVSQNLDLLHRVCGIKVKDAALPHWADAISELRDLFNERNRIFHGIFVEEDEKVILQRTLKGKRGAKDYYHDIEIDDQFLISLRDRLNARRRQLMDFVQDYREDENGVTPPIPASQDKFPSLSFGHHS